MSRRIVRIMHGFYCPPAETAGSAAVFIGIDLNILLRKLFLLQRLTIICYIYLKMTIQGRGLIFKNFPILITKLHALISLLGSVTQPRKAQKTKSSFATSPDLKI